MCECVFVCVRWQLEEEKLVGFKLLEERHVLSHSRPASVNVTQEAFSSGVG